MGSETENWERSHGWDSWASFTEDLGLDVGLGWPQDVNHQDTCQTMETV